MASEQKHTPGPWEVDTLAVRAPNRENPSICVCTPNFVNDGSCYGNARLIAAAPELADCIHDLLYLHVAHHNHPLHVAARALLAKAEG